MDIRSKNPKVEAKPYKLLTYSNMTMWNRCKMEYYFRNIVKIVPVKTSEALHIGAIFHNAIDMYYKTKKESIDQTALIEVNKYIVIANQKNPYYLQSNNDVIIQGMVRGFVHRFADSDYEIVSNEILFDIPFENGEYHRCGKTDAKMIHKSTGQKYLGEWKSTGTLDTYVKKLQVDNQGNNYIWAFEDEKPQGIVFRIAKKSQLRLKKNESIEQYRARISEDYINRPAENYHQEIVYLDLDKLNRWKHEVGQIKDDIDTFTKSNGWYRNTDACWRYGTLCPYAAICKTTNKQAFEEAKRMFYVEREPGEELFTIDE